MMMQKLRGKEGFTLIELMIVIAIIGILAAIAIPNFLAYRTRSYNSAAKSDAKNAYTAAMSYFTTYPTGTIADIATLTGTTYGFTASDGVTTTCAGTANALAISAVHAQGDTTYQVDESGQWTP